MAAGRYHSGQNRDAEIRGSVCMVVHEHFPRDFRVRREARALVQAGYRVVILSLRKPDEPPRECYQGMEVVRLPIRRHRGRPLSVYLAEYLAFAAMSATLVPLMNLRRGFDIVHVHTPPDFLIASGIAAKLSNVRLFIDIHDLTPELYASRFRGQGGRLARFLTELSEWGSCALADQVITTTGAFKKRLIQRGVPGQKIHVVHNCPDPEIFKPIPKTGTGRNPDFVIIHHGTLLRRYGQDLLLEAFEKALPFIPHARMEIYGEGDLMPFLKKQIDKAQLTGKVTLHGEVPQEEIAQALARADLCVVPNRTDEIMELAFPTKLLEALQMGCPVVASATKLVKDTFDSGGLYFVPSGDVSALADALVKFGKDSKARQELVKQGKKQAERFSWEKEKQILLDLYARETGC